MEPRRIHGKRTAKTDPAASASGGRSVTARLRQAEERLRAFQAAAGRIVWIADADGLMIEGLDSWCAFTGQREEEARGLGWETALPPDDRAQLRDLWQQARATRTPFLGSCRVTDVRGHPHRCSFRAAPIVLPDSSLIEWAVVCDELPATAEEGPPRAALDEQSVPYERERMARQALAFRAAELEAILEAVGDGLVVHDQHGNVIWLNATATAQLGITARPDFRELPLLDQVQLLRLRDSEGHPIPLEDSPLARVLRGEVLTGAQAVDITLRALDGRDLCLSVSAAPIRQPDGRISGAVTVMHDVSARRQSERRLRESLDALLALAEGLVAGAELPGTEPLIVPVLTRRDAPPSPMEYMARRLVRLVCHLLGCQRAAILLFDAESNALRSVALAGDTPLLERALLDRMRGIPFEELAGPRVTAQLRAGGVLSVSLLDPPFADIPGIGPTAVLAPLLTTERLLGVLALDRGGDAESTLDERALARAVARMVMMVLERERLLAEREAARAEELALREAARHMDEFLGIASHELKTPVISADLNIQAVARKLNRLFAAPTGRDAQARPEQIIELMEQAKRQMRRLTRLIEDLLDATRIKRGEITIHRVPTALVPIVESALADARAAHPRRVITHAIIPDDPLPLVADPDRIGQVITNYLNNALRYSPADRPVSLLISREGATARVSVRDEGQGIAREELPRIWERFRRAVGVAQQTDAGTGFGLGLYISRAIVELHGGTVGVQSAPGQGATFWFTLPLV